MATILVIAGEDGALYQISEEQLGPYVIQEGDPGYRKARELIAEGATHAAFYAEGGELQVAATIYHLLNLGAFRRPRKEE